VLKPFLLSFQQLLHSGSAHRSETCGPRKSSDLHSFAFSRQDAASCHHGAAGG